MLRKLLIIAFCVIATLTMLYVTGDLKISHGAGSPAVVTPPLNQPAK